MLKKYIRLWVLKRQYMVIGWLVKPIVNSLSSSGVSFAQVNKWLRHINHAPVKGYMMMPEGRQVLFFKNAPDQERRKELGGHYVVVEVGTRRKSAPAIVNQETASHGAER